MKASRVKSEILSKIKYGTIVLPLVLPMLVSAETSVDTPVLGSTCALFDKIKTLVNWAFAFLMLLAVVFAIVAAFRYLTAQGDPEKIKKANHTLIYVAIAVIVGVLATSVPFIVASLLGQEATTDCVTQ